MKSDSTPSGFEYPDDAFEADEVATNDAVAGEPVVPFAESGAPEGSELHEVSPVYDEHELNSEDGPQNLDKE
ncbi:Multidrug transporter [Salinibacterium sp. NYA9b]